MSRCTSGIVLGLLGVCALMGGAVEAGTIRHDRADSAYLTLAQQPQYQSVGQFLGGTSSFDFFASGSLISSNWVLTAAHVVDDATSLNFHLGGTAYTASNWVAHPKWDGDLAKGYDIALVELSIAPSGITPAQRYTGSSEVGKVGTFVGYGMTGTGLTGATVFDQQKRAGQNMIDVYFRTPGKDLRLFGSDFDSPNGGLNPMGSGTPLNLEYLISFGDSGGGVFIEENGQTFLAGVHSFGVDYNRNGLWSDYGDYTGHTRVSAFNSWIDSVLAGNLGGGGGGGNGKGGGKPFVLVPEPSNLALALIGLTILARRRRR